MLDFWETDGFFRPSLRHIYISSSRNVCHQDSKVMDTISPCAFDGVPNWRRKISVPNGVNQRKPSYNCYSLWWFGLFDDFELGGEPSKHIDVYLYVKMQDLIHIENKDPVTKKFKTNNLKPPIYTWGIPKPKTKTQRPKNNNFVRVFWGDIPKKRSGTW